MRKYSWQFYQQPGSKETTKLKLLSKFPWAGFFPVVQSFYLCKQIRLISEAATNLHQEPHLAARLKKIEI